MIVDRMFPTYPEVTADDEFSMLISGVDGFETFGQL